MGSAPENTLLSIRKAIELGADWVEIDVHLADGQLFVIHDETLDRTTNGKGKLSDYSFAKLRALDAGRGEQIPTLQEVIKEAKNKVGLNIELKGLATGEAVAIQLLAFDKEHKDQILVSSFLMDELLKVPQIDKTIKLGVLAGKDVPLAFDWANKLKAYSIHLSLNQVTTEYVQQAHDAGLKLLVYTVNKKVDIARMKLIGVDGVFTNYPDRVLSILLSS
ncbi:MAG: glycerophosphoryl diester phosphodiesterase [Cycloclasticus sp.]|jgi:glycerophosphoryl diester phosphodiesterase|tara:strand:- start:1898 stop:2557 length:660 start_codon:yes stop_codon:yes gene_type:complete